MNVYKFVLYFIKFLKAFYVGSCLQALFSPSIVFRYQENCIFVLFSNVDLKYNSIRFDLFMLHMSTWSSRFGSCHDAVDNGAAAEEDSTEDVGDSGRGLVSSIWPKTTGRIFKLVGSGSSSTTVVVPVEPHFSNPPFLVSLPLDVASFPLWDDAEEEDIIDLQVTPEVPFLQESLLMDWAGDEANSGKGLICPSWKTLSMASQTNLYWEGVWIILARWSLIIRVSSRGYTGWFASIKYKADSIKIKTPVRPIPTI